MAKRSKLYRAQLATFDKNATLNVLDALKTLKAMPAVKFDQTVEIAFKLGVDPKQTDQTVRGAVPLPKGTGKKVVVTVITSNALPPFNTDWTTREKKEANFFKYIFFAPGKLSRDRFC